MRLTALLLAFALSACTQFPELDNAVTSDGASAQYPDLVPVEPILAQATAGPTSEQTTTALNARVAALRARASRLRGTIVDTATRQRMRSGVPQG